MKIAIIHDWLTVYAGAERVLEEMLNCYPDADLFALCDFLNEEDRFFIHNKPVKTSFIQKLPKAKTKYRSYLPLMPLAIEQLNVTEYDIVISSNHAVAKGVITSPDQLHICMCYSPIRYAWDLTHQYLKESGLDHGIKGWIAKYFLHKIRMWDYRTANGVDRFIAISDYIARRIKKTYNREADIIYPPVNVDYFNLCEQKEDYYLTVSRLVPYKRVELIVETFSIMPDKKLIVIGDGPQFEKVKLLAGSNVKLIGFQKSEVIREYMQNAKAFIFAANEDFGIVPIEAQACGTPVIAYGKGGSLETVTENVSGLFFKEQTVESLVETIEKFETVKNVFYPAAIRENAQKFSIERFRLEFKTYVEQTYEEFYKNRTQLNSKEFSFKKFI